MPLFFFVSGLFFKNSFDRDPVRFWRARLISVVYPYFLWSVIYCVVLTIISGSGIANSDGMSLDRILTIFWVPISPFWFLYALFFSTVFSSLLREIHALIQLVFALIIFIIFMELMRYSVIQDVFYGYVYFSLGMLSGRFNIMSRVRGRSIVVFLFSFVFIIVSSIYYYIGTHVRMAFISAFFGMFIVFYISILIEKWYPISIFTNVFRFLGQFSMSIFVMHILILGFVRTVWSRVLHLDDFYLLLIVGTCAGIIIPAAVALAFGRLGFGQVLGLSTSATRRYRSIP